MRKLGYTLCDADPQFILPTFLYRGVTILIVHVDDILIAQANRQEATKLDN